jgi:hypothetical protein
MLHYQSTICGTKNQVHLQFYIEATERTEGKDFYPLAVALAQLVYEKDTTAPYTV